MQKKIIALAIAAAVSAPAFADTTVYGVLDTTIQSVKTNAAGQITNNSIANNASRFGVKVSEDLGNGLTALGQLEAAVDPVNGGNLVTANAAGRNSRLGVSGGFGTAFVGNWDLPYKTAHNKVELFDNAGVFSTTTATGLVGQGAIGRAANTIQYFTPDMGNGVSVKAAYVMAPGKTAAANPSLYSLSATYDNAGIYAALAFESGKDAAAAAGQKDSNTRLVAAYTMGDMMGGVTYQRQSNTVGAVTAVAAVPNGPGVLGVAAVAAAPAGSSISTTVWELVGTYAMGTSSFGAAFAMRGNQTNSTAATTVKADQLTLKYGYEFSKRTSAYVAYTQNTAKNTAGLKTTGYGVGLRHTF